MYVTQHISRKRRRRWTERNQRKEAAIDHKVNRTERADWNDHRLLSKFPIHCRFWRLKNRFNMSYDVIT